MSAMRNMRIFRRTYQPSVGLGIRLVSCGSPVNLGDVGSGCYCLALLKKPPRQTK